MKESKCAILGASEGYDSTDIAPFVKSLRSTGYSGKVILWQTKNASKVMQLATQHQIEIISINKNLLQWFKEVKILKQQKSLFKKLAISRKIELLHISLKRYFLYNSHITKLEKQGIENIILTDVRDVIFQENPFIFKNCLLHTGIEEKLIESSKVNLNWLNQVFSDSIQYQSILQNHVICSGVTVGNISYIKRYLNKICNLIISKIDEIRSDSSLDQALHNYIYYIDKIDGFNGWTNESSELFTMHGLSKDSVLLNQNNQIINKKGHIYKIVHQYDRFPAIAKMIKNKYKLIDLKKT